MQDKRKLALVFGEQFVREYTIALAKKRAERERLLEKEAVEFVKCIADGEFKPDNPSIEIDRNRAMLLEMPSNEDVIERMTRTLEGGAVSKGMLFCGEFISCLFNDPALTEKLEPGQFYIAIGRYYETPRMLGAEEGAVFKNLQVKALATLDEFQKMVDAVKAGEKVDVTPLYR